jgi:hypothetical protein
MLVHKRKLCWGMPAVVDEEADNEAAVSAAPAAVGPAGSSSPTAMSSPVGTVDSLASVPATRVGASIEPAEELGVQGATEDAVVQAEDVIARRQRLIRWFGERCIYCTVTKAPPSRHTHWHGTCKRSQSIPDGRSYEEALD